MSEIDALIERGLAAVEDENYDEAKAVIDEAKQSLGQDDVRVQHLQGLLAWADGDIEAATKLLEAAANSETFPQLTVDYAGFLFETGDPEEAESVIAKLRESKLEAGLGDDATLLHAQVLLNLGRPEDSMSVLEHIRVELHTHVAYLATKGSVLLATEQFDAAVAVFKESIERESDNPELWYQLGVSLDASGQIPESLDAMLKVLEIDNAEWSEMTDVPAEPEFAEVQELRTRLEEIFEGLPDPVLKLVGHAPITVQGRASVEQVKAGIDPRARVVFTGKPKNESEEAELTGIVVMRNVVLESIEEDDDVEGELFYGLLEQIQDFYDRDDIIVTQA